MAPKQGEDYTHLPQLLKANGDYFSALVYIRRWHKPFNRKAWQVQTVGTNDEAVAVIGDAKKTIPAMTIEPYSEDAYDEVLAAMGDETTGMMFEVRIPSLSNPSNGVRYLVRILEANLTRLYDRRSIDTELFQAELENVRVYGQETY